MIRTPFNRSILIRMLADAALVTAAFAIAVGLRLLYLIGFEAPDGDIGEFVRRDWFHFLCTCPLIVLTTLASCWFIGIYTYSKNYLSQYKVLVVAQAVSLSYVAFGFLAYFMTGGDLIIARGAFFLAWPLTIAFLATARLWNDVWHKHVAPQRASIIRQKTGERKTLVIGGGGYIGSALIPLLLERGDQVRLLDMLLFGEGPIASFADHPNLEIVRGDFRHTETVLSCVRDVDSVVHLGAIVGDPACSLNEDLTIDVNLVSTRVIAHLARSVGVERFIFASTCSVYGACDELLDERSQVQPVSLYGDTKLASENLLLEMTGDGFAPTILRFATIYGLSGRTRFDLVVNLLTAKAKLEGEITVHGGSQWRPFVHVKDAARAIAASLEAPKQLVADEIFNVGSNEQNHTVLEIAEMVMQNVAGAKMIVAEDLTDHRNYRVSFDKIFKRLGFTPEFNINDGIQQVLDAIANGEIQNYGDAQYSNVKFLTEEGTDKLAKDQWARQLIEDLSRQQ